MSGRACSVVIPSYNRRATLQMVLEGLARQTLPAAQFEVIVVLDGATDDSQAMLERWQATGQLPNLRWRLQANSGQAAARNAGAALASAPVIVFLDDDVVPQPELLEAHLRWHARGEPVVVLGDCLVVREERESLYHLGVWSWWEDKYHRRALDGRRPSCRDFCAGNVSLRRADFVRVGGFARDFRGYGGEDFELGYRLLRAGARFVADRRARAYHYHRISVAGVLRATRQEGRGDILLGHKHPEIRAGLRLMHIPRGRYGLLVRTALQAPALGDLIAVLLVGVLPLLQLAKLRRKWLALFDHLRGYAYWRGVRDGIGSLAALRIYQAGAAALPEQEIDISDGLPEILPPLWVEGPSKLRVTLHGRELAMMVLPGPFEAPVHSYLAAQLIAQLGERLLPLLDHDGLPIADSIEKLNEEIVP